MAAWKLAPGARLRLHRRAQAGRADAAVGAPLGELLQEAGLPDGVVNIVTGFGDAGAALAAHDDVDKVAFTGSTEVGKLIVQAAAGNLKKVSLELGGKSPNVVFADADLDSAIIGASNGIFFNHGQCCNAGSRLYVQIAIFDDVVAGVAEQAKQIKVAPGNGPRGADGAADLRRAVREGARLPRLRASRRRRGGRRRRAGRRARLLRPADGPHEHQPRHEGRARGDLRPGRLRDPVRQPDEIVPVANDTNYGLAAGVFTRDISKAHRTAERLRAGTVWINTYHVFDAAQPFGGYKESGWGREMGHQVLENYLETKSVVTAL